MQETKWQTDKDGFIEAIENDEYAELVLPNGDTLITDWEGDGVFNPYVELTNDHGDKHPTDIMAEIESAIYDVFEIYVTTEMDNNNGVVVPHFRKRPTN